MLLYAQEFPQVFEMLTARRPGKGKGKGKGDKGGKGDGAQSLHSKALFGPPKGAGKSGGKGKHHDAGTGNLPSAEASLDTSLISAASAEGAAASSVGESSLSSAPSAGTEGVSPEEGVSVNKMVEWHSSRLVKFVMGLPHAKLAFQSFRSVCLPGDFVKSELEELYLPWETERQTSSKSTAGSGSMQAVPQHQDHHLRNGAPAVGDLLHPEQHQQTVPPASTTDGTRHVPSSPLEVRSLPFNPTNMIGPLCDRPRERGQHHAPP